MPCGQINNTRHSVLRTVRNKDSAELLGRNGAMDTYQRGDFKMQVRVRLSQVVAGVNALYIQSRVLMMSGKCIVRHRLPRAGDGKMHNITFTPLWCTFDSK